MSQPKQNKQKQLKTYFVTSDVHGFYDQLMSSLTEKGFDIINKNHHLILCGDAFDRGQQAVKMFEFLKLLNDQHRLTYIKGNHENLLYECFMDMADGYYVESHHRHNKTTETIFQFSNINEWELKKHSNPEHYLEARELFESRLNPVLNFIDKNTVPYAELKSCDGQKYIFTHGWIPSSLEYDKCGFHVLYSAYNPKWRHSLEEDFNDSTWECGWRNWYGCADRPGCRVPNTIVVCGHWHCNEPNYLLHDIGYNDQWTITTPLGEPDLELKKTLFSTFKENNAFAKVPGGGIDYIWKIDKPSVPSLGGIWCLDACTAYSGIVNVEVIKSYDKVKRGTIKCISEPETIEIETTQDVEE